MRFCILELLFFHGSGEEMRKNGKSCTKGQEKAEKAGGEMGEIPDKTSRGQSVPKMGRKFNKISLAFLGIIT